jgi:hypothetical protein
MMLIILKKMIVKMVEKKLLRWTYLINYLDNVVSAHLFIDSDSYRKFEDVQ